jgi:multidrug resistance protein MdtO
LINTPGGASAWIENIYQELAPTHGRMAGALRTALAATIATVVLLALRAPAMAVGVYLIFIVSYDAPYLTFRNSVVQLCFQCLGVATALVLVEVTGNDPMARVLGVALFTFISAFFLRACTRPTAAMTFGIYSIITLSLWELHMPAELLLHRSMWPIGTGALAVGCKVAIEYAFTRRDPQHALLREMDVRLEALEELFRRYADDAPEEEIQQRILRVRRYAFAGQSKMRSLLEEVLIHPAKDMAAFAISPGLIPTIARLLDLGAAYGEHYARRKDVGQHARFQRLAMAIDALRTGRVDEVESLLSAGPKVADSVLGQIEQTLHSTGAMSYADHVVSQEQYLKDLPGRKSSPWLHKDAWSNPAYVVYAVKLSLCATLCYVIYNALAWPGISTATLTVLIAGLSTTGATYQRMLFRILGSVVGGVIFGIGCIIFVFPYADTAIPFLVAVACVSFIGAWIARSAHFGYVGLQIVFSFYLIAFEGFSAPTLMTPARDRLIGIFLALIVMWAIFHQLHPERTVDKMRHGLARLLTIEADVLYLLRTARFGGVPALREEADEIVGTIRAFAEVIPYELDRHIAKDQAISEQIQNAISTTGSFFLMAFTWPRTSETSEWDKITSYPNAVLEQGLRNLSRLLEGATICAESEEFKPELPDTKLYGPWPEPIQNTLNVYAELQIQCREIAIGSVVGEFQV